MLFLTARGTTQFVNSSVFPVVASVGLGKSGKRYGDFQPRHFCAAGSGLECRLDWEKRKTWSAGVPLDDPVRLHAKALKASLKLHSALLASPMRFERMLSP